MTSPSIIVIGGLNTDIISSGMNRLLQAGELGYAKNLTITAGGKSRNLAQMIALLSKPGKVAMIGRTSRDPFQLWKVPYDALINSGVNVDSIKILDFAESQKFPGIALIPVDNEGRNQIYLIPGVNNDFCPQDIDDATELFENASKQNGILALSLEMPISTAKHAIKKAKNYGLRVILDPGGIQPITSENQYNEYLELLSLGIDVIKPNEHEMKILTRVDILDFESANLGTHLFRKMGIKNTLITVGNKGAYLFTEKERKYIPIQPVQPESKIMDETGCGDQSMAVICSLLHQGMELEKAAEIAILAGTLQFHRSGVNPLAMEDIEKYF